MIPPINLILAEDGSIICESGSCNIIGFVTLEQLRTLLHNLFRRSDTNSRLKIIFSSLVVGHIR